MEKSMDNQNRTRTEEITINGEDLVAKVKELVREGNVRRLSIRNDEGRTLIEVPLTTGGAIAAAAVVLVPVWAAIGAIAALAANLTIVIERVDNSMPQLEQPPAETDQPQTQG
jgi:hypothetical protein